MNNIIYKVAPAGEGKTKWLLNMAKYYSDNNRTCYLFCDDDYMFNKFCRKYFQTFSELCPVKRLKAFRLTKDDVVLVDDMLNMDASLADFLFIQQNCYQMCVTIAGVSADKELVSEVCPYEQLQLGV